MSLSESLIGRNMNAHPECLGIYISLDEIYVAQTAKKDGGTVLESLVRVPINDVDRTQLKPLDLNESFFAQDAWRESLNKITAKKKWKTNNVVISLAPSFCLLRHFIIPTMIERKMWKNSIPLQARKYIHFPFEKAEYAYHVYEFETATTKQKRLGVVFAMTTKSIIDRLKKGCKGAGLNLISVETAGLSLGRAFNDADKEAVGNGGRIYSFFGSSMASFVFLNENAPVLLREVEIAGSAPAEHRHFELTNSTEFIAKQLERDPFEEAVISGRNADLWVPALEADSKKPVRKWDLKEVYGIETRAVGEIAAIGASIKFFDHKTPDIDFTKGLRLSDYEYNASLTFWKVTAVIALILLALIGKGYWDVQKSTKELRAKRQASGQILPEFQGMSGSQIQSNLSAMKTQNENLNSMLRYDTVITPVFVELMDSIPSDVWISKMTYKDVFPPKGGDMREIILEGFIKTGKNGQADMAMGNEFKDKFIAMPTISKICGNSAVINYSNIAGASGSGGASSGRSGGRSGGGSQETNFVLKCSRATTQGGR